MLLWNMAICWLIWWTFVFFYINLMKVPSCCNTQQTCIDKKSHVTFHTALTRGFEQTQLFELRDLLLCTLPQLFYYYDIHRFLDKTIKNFHKGKQSFPYKEGILSIGKIFCITVTGLNFNLIFVCKMLTF